MRLACSSGINSSQESSVKANQATHMAVGGPAEPLVMDTSDAEFCAQTARITYETILRKASGHLTSQTSEISKRDMSRICGFIGRRVQFNKGRPGGHF